MKNFYKKYKNFRSSKDGFMGGFTILYSVIVAGVLLSIALSMYSIGTRSLFLSSTSGESTIAISAADAGLECALYYEFTDLNANFIAKITDFDTVAGTEDARTKKCANTWTLADSTGLGVDDIVYEVAPTFDPNPVSTKFKIFMNSLAGKPDTNGPCAVVKVTKLTTGADAGSTTIDSRGYNTCNSVSPRIVERGLRVTYKVLN